MLASHHHHHVLKRKKRANKQNADHITSPRADKEEMGTNIISMHDRVTFIETITVYFNRTSKLDSSIHSTTAGDYKLSLCTHHIYPMLSLSENTYSKVDSTDKRHLRAYNAKIWIRNLWCNTYTIAGCSLHKEIIGWDAITVVIIQSLKIWQNDKFHQQDQFSVYWGNPDLWSKISWKLRHPLDR